MVHACTILNWILTKWYIQERSHVSLSLHTVSNIKSTEVDLQILITFPISALLYTASKIILSWWPEIRMHFIVIKRDLSNLLTNSAL